MLGAAIALGPAGVGVSPIPSVAAVAAGLAVFALSALVLTRGLLDDSFPAIRKEA